MLTINTAQMEVFEYQSMGLFIKKSIPFLKENAPKFTKEKSDDELEKLIIKAIQFAESHNIKKEINVRRIMLLKIEHDFSYKLTDNLKFGLSGTSFSEDYRLGKFEKSFAVKSKRTVIDLNSEL